MLGQEASIAAPDGPVRLTRSVEPALLGAAGNVAVTGVPGSGKTVLLHALAQVAQVTHDLAVFRAEDLRSTKAATRAELGLRHDIAEVLAGWTGQRPGLLLIDGIDQARGPDAPDWLPVPGGRAVRNAMAGSGDHPLVRPEEQPEVEGHVPRYPG